MNKNSRIYVAGHTGLVGSAIVRLLKDGGYTNLLLRKSSMLDLRNQQSVNSFFKSESPEYVFLAAARVGGILANNTYRADFIYDNIMIAANIIHASFKYGVKKLLNLGSSCIYPKYTPQPMKEEYLLTGKLEPTNEPYAIAKISAIKLCRYFNEQYGTNFISVMPTNLYGPYDTFDLENSHVLPALIRKFDEAQKAMKQGREEGAIVWGDGTPKREFLYVDDLAEAILFLMENYDYEHIGEFVNVGVGKDISIKQLADMIAQIVKYKGPIRWDTNKPNGTPRKMLDVTRIKELGWEASTGLQEGLEKTYKWYLDNVIG